MATGWLALWSFVVALCVPTALAAAEEDAAAQLFGRYKDRIFQVRLVNLEADEKAALGTGFLVARNDLIATNFHVIAQLVHHPGKYRLEYVDEQGEQGDLELLEIDVVNDLALLRSREQGVAPLRLPDAVPTQGDTIYSLGNPHDIGFTVIPGTYNGLEVGSYYEHIHFSGSINAGMSGGPVLDRDGGVVGINVSSAGNQVSFLVPARALKALVRRSRDLDAPVDDFKARLSEQLVANQRRLVEGVLEKTWPSQPLGDATVLGEMQPYVKCWGDSSDEDELYKLVSSSCRSSQQIFLKYGFSTGVIAYQFFWLEANELSAPRFERYYASIFGSFQPDNRAGEDDVGAFVCDEDFVVDPSDHTDKVVICLRAYREHASLYDVLYLRGSVDESEHAFISHFTLAGVERALATEFLERFQEIVHR